MASLDFIDNSTKAYAFVWHHRRYLFQTAIPVLFIKILCILMIFASGIADLPLREGLFLLPSHAVEALFLMNLIRFCLYKEPIYIWGKMVPVPPSIAKEVKFSEEPSHRKIAIEAGIIVYLLIQIIFRIFYGIWLIIFANDFQTIGQPSPDKALIILAFLGGIFWSFRLLWLYVPIGAGIRITDFLNEIKGIPNSLYFIAVAIICSGPFMMVYLLMLNLIEILLGPGNALNVIVISILQSLMIITILSIQTVAVSIGTCTLMYQQKKE